MSGLLRLVARCVCVVLTVASPPDAAAPNEDHRAWQHGIDLLRVGARLLAVWSSPGNPPRPNVGGDWQHDVHYSWVDDDGGIVPQLLVVLDDNAGNLSGLFFRLHNKSRNTDNACGSLNDLFGYVDGLFSRLHDYAFLKEFNLLILHDESDGVKITISKMYIICNLMCETVAAGIVGTIRRNAVEMEVLLGYYFTGSREGATNLGVWTVRVRVSVTTRGTWTSTVRSSYVMTGTYGETKIRIS